MLKERLDRIKEGSVFKYSKTQQIALDEVLQNL